LNRIFLSLTMAAEEEDWERAAECGEISEIGAFDDKPAPAPVPVPATVAASAAPKTVAASAAPKTVAASAAPKTVAASAAPPKTAPGTAKLSRKARLRKADERSRASAGAGEQPQTEEPESELAAKENALMRGAPPESRREQEKAIAESTAIEQIRDLCGEDKPKTAAKTAAKTAPQQGKAGKKPALGRSSAQFDDDCTDALDDM